MTEQFTLERNNLDYPSVNYTLMSILNFINTFKSLIDYYCNKKDPSIFRLGSLVYRRSILFKASSVILARSE